MAWNSQPTKQAITLECATVLTGTGSRADVPFPITEAAFATAAIDGGVDSMSSDAGDLSFYSDADGLTRLPCDIIHATIGGTPRLLIRVLVDIADVTADQTIYAAYGDGVSSQPAVGAAYGQYATYPNLLSYVQSDGTITMSERANASAWTFGTFVVDPSTEDCPFGFGPYYAGAGNAYTDVAAIADVTTSNDFSVLIYTKQSGYGGNYTGLDWSNTDSSQELTLNPMDNALTAGGPRARDTKTGYNYLSAAHGSTQANNYVHTGLHRRSSTSHALSANGVEVATSTNTSAAITHTRLNIGSRRSANSGYLKFGYMMLFDAAITQLYELTIVELDSDPTSAVTAGTPEDIVANTPPTGSITISGSTVQGATLTMSDTLADVDGLGTFARAWLRDDVVIGGETATTYELTALDINTTIKARISYTDGGSTDESEESAATATITGAVQTTYQQCKFELTINNTYVDGLTSFTDFPVSVFFADMPTSFYDNGTGSWVNGGGNIRAYTDEDLTSRLPVKVSSDFNTIAETGTLQVLRTVNAIATTSIWLVRVNSDAVQPAADEAYGSDLITNATTSPDNADLTSTLASQASDAAFSTGGAASCETIGGSTSVEGQTQQGLRHASFNALHGGALRTYNGDVIAGCLASDGTITATTYNGVLGEWLYNQGYTQDTLNGRLNAFAVTKGAENWSGLGSFTV